MKKVKISIALATYNEEKNIVDCISSAKLIADEVVIADGTSTDRTKELAKQLGARVITTTNKIMFHINKNLAIDSCKGKWVFLMDADERISPELAGEVKQKIEKNPVENGFFVSRRNWFLGGFLTKGGAYPDRVIRLFRKGKGRLPEKDVHEQVRIDGKVGYLKNGDLIHFADPDFERYLRRSLRYTDLTASHIKENNTSVNIITVIFFMIVKPTVTFFNIYLRHKGYQDGFRGFVWALFSAAHHYYAFAKYWQENNTK